jgi:hypothetical protein
MLNTGLAAVLVASGFAFRAQPAGAQVQITRAGGLSPQAQQMIKAILQGLPPQDSSSCYAAFSSQNRASRDLRLHKEMVITGLESLPVQCHGAFIDGLFQVSPAEEQFARQVLNQIVQNRIDAELFPG